jgi:hypothetical protein
LFFSQEGAIDWRRIAIAFPNETQFTEGGLTPGVTYYYRVRATTTWAPPPGAT